MRISDWFKHIGASIIKGQELMSWLIAILKRALIKKSDRPTSKIIVPFGCIFIFATALAQPNSARQVIEAWLYLDAAPVRITIDGDKIALVERTEGDQTVDRDKVFVAPGLIDCQVNGYADVGFTDADLTVEGVRRVTRKLWQVGVTTYVPTVITNSHERIQRNLKILSKSNSDPMVQLAVPGFFLEGPYISPQDGFRGAHSAEWIRPPNWEEFSVYLDASDRQIIQIGVAPEIAGAQDFILRCVQQGIVVSLAHHNGSADQIKQAVDAGARISTHLGNGCANLIHRHRNPLWPQLAEDRLISTLIVDGHHLTPEEVRVFYKVKGPDRIVLVSDMTRLAGMPPGEYTWGGKKVVMTAEGEIRYPAQEVLAGASAPLSAGIANLLRFADCSLAEAIHTATRNPARIYGFEGRGEIVPGKRADLILFTLENERIIIQETIVAGQVVYEKP